MGDHPLAPSQAPGWGLARTLRREHPELRCTCLDLDPAAGGEAEIEAILAELDLDAEPEVALRRGLRYVPRLARARRARPPVRPASRLPTRRRRTGEPRWAPARGARPKGPRARRGGDRGRGDRPQLQGRPLRARHVPRRPGSARRASALDAWSQWGRASRTSRPATTSWRWRGAASPPTSSRAPSSWLAGRPASVPRRGPRSPSPSSPPPSASTTSPRSGRGSASWCTPRRAASAWPRCASPSAPGPSVFATAGSAAKRELLRELGVEHVFDSRSAAFAGEVLRAHRRPRRGRGAQLALGRAVEAELRAPWPGAGASSRSASATSTTRRRWRRWAATSGTTVVDWGETAARDPELIGGLLERLVDELGSGALAPLPRHVFAARRGAARLPVHGPGAATPARSCSGTGHRLRRAVRRDGTYLVTGGLHRPRGWSSRAGSPSAGRAGSCWSAGADPAPRPRRVARRPARDRRHGGGRGARRDRRRGARRPPARGSGAGGRPLRGVFARRRGARRRRAAPAGRGDGSRASSRPRCGGAALLDA